MTQREVLQDQGMAGPERQQETCRVHGHRAGMVDRSGHKFNVDKADGVSRRESRRTHVRKARRTNGVSASQTGRRGARTGCLRHKRRACRVSKRHRTRPAPTDLWNLEPGGSRDHDRQFLPRGEQDQRCSIDWTPSVPGRRESSRLTRVPGRPGPGQPTVSTRSEPSISCPSNVRPISVIKLV